MPPPPFPQVKLCLVVNKLDRLILELCLTPAEAYERLKAIIAHVNMIVSSFHSEKYISGGWVGAALERGGGHAAAAPLLPLAARCFPGALHRDCPHTQGLRGELPLCHGGQPSVVSSEDEL